MKVTTRKRNILDTQVYQKVAGTLLIACLFSSCRIVDKWCKPSRDVEVPTNPQVTASSTLPPGESVALMDLLKIMKKHKDVLEKYKKKLYSTTRQQVNKLLLSLSDTAQDLEQEGWGSRHQNNLSQALEYFEQALEIRQALHEGNNHDDLAKALTYVGTIHLDLHDYTQAFGCFEQALKIRQDLHPGNNHGDLAKALTHVGKIYLDLHNYAQALGCFEQALKIRTTLHAGNNHGELAKALGRMRLAYEGLSRNYHEQARAMQQALKEEEDHADVAEALRTVEIFNKHLDNNDQALEYFKQVLKIRQRQHPGEDNLDVAETLNDVGLAHLGSGNNDQALEYFKQVLERQQALHKGEDHLDVAKALNDVGLAHLGLGNNDQALERFEKALLMYQQLYEGNHPDVAESLLNVGVAYGCLSKEYNDLALEMHQALQEEEEDAEVNLALFDDNPVHEHNEATKQRPSLARTYIPPTSPTS